MQVWLHFYQSTPRWNWGVRVPSVEYEKPQEIGSTYDHYLPRGDKGLVVRIKCKEITSHPNGLTYEQLQPNISTLLSLFGT